MRSIFGNFFKRTGGSALTGRDPDFFQSRFWPVLNQIDFIEGRPKDLAMSYLAWRARTPIGARAVEMHPISGSFADKLMGLLPLSSGPTHRVLITGGLNGWTAIQSNRLGSQEGYNSIRPPGARSVVYRSSDSRIDYHDELCFEYFAGGGTEAASQNPYRWVRKRRYGKEGFGKRKWEFFQFGEPLPFEEAENYGKKAVEDRLTLDMVEKYFEHLGISLFDPGFYSGDAFLIDCSVPEWKGGRYKELSDYPYRTDPEGKQRAIEAAVVPKTPFERGIIRMNGVVTERESHGNPHALALIEAGRGNLHACTGSFKRYFEAKALLAWFEDDDLDRFKQNCYWRSKILRMEYQIQPTDRLHVDDLFWPVMSDNEQMIGWYANHELPHFCRIKDAEDPKLWQFFDYQVFLALRGDWERMIKRGEKFFAASHPKMKKYFLDQQFLLALARGDHSEMEKVLAELTSSRVTKARENDMSFITATEDFICTFPTLYAKIALRHGYQLKFDTPSIPSAWMPIQPVAQGSDPYPFMARFDIEVPLPKETGGSSASS